MTFASIRMTFAAALLFGVVAWSLSLLMPSSGVQANTLIVTNNADSGPGSLRQAITDAAANDTILFDASLGGATITLAGSQLTINKNLTITGPSGGITVDGNLASKVFVIPGGTVSMSNVNITRGSAGNYGGGIEVDGGNLSLSNSSVYGNQVTIYGPALAVMSGSATLNNVTVSGNAALNGHGGGIVAFADITLTNVTISGNTATGNASALMVSDAPGRHVTANLVNVTISNNSSGFFAYGALNASACPPDICGGLTLSLTNTIIASQAAGQDCSLGLFVPPTSSHSLDSDNSCQLFGGTSNQSGVNPVLGPLALRAPGSTMTHSLGAGSPAIDAGDDATCPQADQRGVSRALGAHCDIGAYERVPGLIQGDVDCNGAVTAVDALKELRYVAQLSVSQTEPCPDIGINVVSIWGDVDCKGEPTAVDALVILRYIAGLPVQQTEPCPDLAGLIPGG